MYNRREGKNSNCDKRLQREMKSELVKMPANVCNLLFKQILLQESEVHRYALENKF